MTPDDTALALLGELAAHRWLGLARRGNMQRGGMVWCDHCDGRAVAYTEDAPDVFKHDRDCVVMRVREFLRGE